MEVMSWAVVRVAMNAADLFLVDPIFVGSVIFPFKCVESFPCEVPHVLFGSLGSWFSS